MTEQIETPPPLQVVDSTAKEQAGALGRDLLILIGALPALLAVLGTRDLKAIVDYLASDGFAPAMGVLLLLAVTVWRQLITRWQKRKLITAAASADDDVAIVVQK